MSYQPRLSEDIYESNEFVPRELPFIYENLNFVETYLADRINTAGYSGDN